jgi:hypothetical protein
MQENYPRLALRVKMTQTVEFLAKELKARWKLGGRIQLHSEAGRKVQNPLSGMLMLEDLFVIYERPESRSICLYYRAEEEPPREQWRKQPVLRPDPVADYSQFSLAPNEESNMASMRSVDRFFSSQVFGEPEQKASTPIVLKEIAEFINNLKGENKH